MSLTNVWLQTRSDGLVRADQVIGIDAHQSPALTGKPSRWLLDVVVAVPIGSGGRDGWAMTALHRTLEQADDDPGDAPASLARLLAQLDLVNAAGVITVGRDVAAPVAGADVVADARQVRFRFAAFSHPDPGRHTGAEYL